MTEKSHRATSANQTSPTGPASAADTHAEDAHAAHSGTRSASDRALPIIIVVYLALALLLIVRVPLGQAPDEAAHWEYARFIATQHALPVFTGAPPPQPGYEFHQPPLYYLLCAPGWMLKEPLALYFCRIVSTLFGLATLLLISMTARRLWPQRDDLMILATGFAALWPLHLSVSAVSGNDAAAGFFCAAMFYGIARGGTQGWTQQDVIVAGLCAGLGLWTKTTTLPVSLATWFMAWELARQGRAARLGPLAAPGAMALFGLLVAAPLLIRNQMLYGDPLGWGAFAQAATAGTPGFPLMSQIGITFFVYVRGLLLMLFCTAWGFFGGPGGAVNALRPLSHTPHALPAPLFPLAAMCALATIIGVMGMVRGRAALVVDHPIVIRWWRVGVLLILLSWAQFAYQHFSGGQARYFHPALLPVVLAFALGWQQVWGNVWRGRALLVMSILLGCTLVALTLANAFGWRTLS